MSYEVKVDAFSGPLDLLLHLIQRLEIDIYDIPVAEITAQYMDHIHAMQVLELDEASEYLVMAATLLAIKSRMLLPIHEGELDDSEFIVDEPDPRDELVQRLIEYKKYKEAAQQLQQQAEEQAKLYYRPAEDLSAYAKDEQLVLFDDTGNVYDMLAAFQKMLHRRKLQQPLATRVTRQGITISAQMKNVFTSLQRAGGRSHFEDLFEHYDREIVIATFLSVLEMMKRQMITIEQQSNFAELIIVLQQEEWQDEQFDSIDYTN